MSEVARTARTLYPIIGDLFSWKSVVGTLTLVIIGVVQPLRSQKVKAASLDSKSEPDQAN